MLCILYTCNLLPCMLYCIEHKVAVRYRRLLFSDKNHYFCIHHKIRLYNCNRICNLLFLLCLQHLRTFRDHCKHHHFYQSDISNTLDPTRHHWDSTLLIRQRKLYPENCSWLSLAIPLIWPAPLWWPWPLSKILVCSDCNHRLKIYWWHLWRQFSQIQYFSKKTTHWFYDFKYLDPDSSGPDWNHSSISSSYFSKKELQAKLSSFPPVQAYSKTCNIRVSDVAHLPKLFSSHFVLPPPKFCFTVFSTLDYETLDLIWILVI